MIGVTLGTGVDALAAPDMMQMAQARPTPAPSPSTPAAAPMAPAADAQQTAAEPVGNVASLSGSASVTRNNATTPLELRDDIFAGDVVETGAESALGITFNDATTFNLTANAMITIDHYLYEEGGQQNGALFDVAKGTLAFVAASVARTGDMRISTPTATLGIRGTTGLVEVPEGATATSNNVAIKLNPDPDGRVGRIEINDRSGVQLGTLTRGASGFAIRGGMGGARLAAVPLTISPQQVLRDQGFVRQLHSTQDPAGAWSTSSAPSAAPIQASPIRTAASRCNRDQRPNGLPGPNHHAASAGAAWPSASPVNRTASPRSHPARRTGRARNRRVRAPRSNRGKRAPTQPRRGQQQPSRPARRPPPSRSRPRDSNQPGRNRSAAAADSRTSRSPRACSNRLPGQRASRALQGAGAAASRSTVRTTATACAAAGCAGRAPRAAAGIAEPAGTATAPGSGAEREKGTGPVLNDGKRGIRPRGAASPGPFE